MARNIFTVTALIVDANGTKSILSGYPKDFDSKNYVDEAHPLPDGDVEKAKKRAIGDASDVWGVFCKRDDRLIQTVSVVDIFGRNHDLKTMGSFPEPTPEPEEPEEPAE